MEQRSNWMQGWQILLTALEGTLLLGCGHHAGLLGEAASSRGRGRGAQHFRSHRGANKGRPSPRDDVHGREVLGSAQQHARWRKCRGGCAKNQEEGCASQHFLSSYTKKRKPVDVISGEKQEAELLQMRP